MPAIRNKSHNDMMNILAQFAMSNLGFGPVGEIRMLSATSGNCYAYYRDRILEANFHTKVSKAEAACVTQRNDVIVVTPASHAWAGDTHAGGEALTWDKTSTHMIGMSPASLAGYNRARFSHSGYTMANFMTVSGDDNCFKNLRFMHGATTGGASDITCVTVSGHGNRFEHVSFAGPNDVTQGASANYLGVVVSGSHNYFKNCMFGSVNAVLRTDASCILQFPAAAGSFNVFENCLFRSAASVGTPYFISEASTGTASYDYTAIFLNCQFLNTNTALTVAISKAANTTRRLYFDNRCSFAGVTDIIAAAQEAEIYWGASGSPASSSATAPNDRLNMGIAQTADYA